MEANEVENAQTCPTEGGQLTRNRSFKTKQLVRSQAIRESQSPPRSLTPAAVSAISREPDGTTTSQLERKDRDVGGAGGVKMHSVEIQITTGCDSDPANAVGNGQRERAARWLGHDCQLLSHPLVTCVCRCASCSGLRREYNCQAKYDSGIACSEDCPDYTGGAGDGIVKSPSEDLGISDATYCKCPERKEKPKNILMKSDSAEERSELTGPELIDFIKETLNKSYRDRVALLKIEKELHALVNDTSRTLVRFPVMSSYGRMLVHRCATLFQLSHNLDYNKTAVIVTKTGTSGGRIPCKNFKQWCTTVFSPSYTQEGGQAKSILKRLGSGSQEGSPVPTAARSLAQRQRDYDQLRTRIFNSEDESNWPWLSGQVKLLTPDSGRNKLLKVQSLEGASEPKGRERGVSKSHSFTGYPPESQQRQLSRQGDLASSSWRLSPSSSGYKTLSLRSTDSITPSPTGGVSPEPNPGPLNPTPGLTMSELNPVPGLTLSEMVPGPHTQLLLHPQTGRPLLNPDGSLYQYDPNNPPVLYDEQSEPASIQQIDQNNEKRRGRLEKQHSFIETEYESAAQVLPEHSYQRSLSCNTYSHEQVPTQTEQIVSPKKQRYEVTPTATNQIVAAQDLSANHAATYEHISSNRPPSVETVPRQDKLPLDPIQYSAHIDYMLGYRPDAVVDSTNQHIQTNYAQTNIHGVTKAMPLQAIQDPNIRTLPMPSVVYPTHVPQGYSYPAHCRVESGAYAGSVYHPVPVAPSMDEQHKQIAQSDNTFRIDASYPYAPLEAYACGNQCVTGCTMDPTHHRSVYATQPVESQGAVYPLTNIMIPQQYPLAQYQPLQWQPNLQPILTPITSNCTTPLQKPITPPNLYLPPTELPIYPAHIYQQGQMYPLIQYQLPFVHQTYPFCPNVYPIDQRTDTRTFNSARTTPQIEEISDKNQPYEKDSKVQYPNSERVENKDGLSQDLAFQIQKINERFSTLSAEDKGESPRNFRGERYDYYKRRNNGNGILGSYPANSGYNKNYGRQANDDAQLTTAARAIVHSIRNMQSKTHYQTEAYRRAQEQQNRTEGQPQQPYQAYQPYNPQKQEIYQKPENYQKPEDCQKHENYQKPENAQTSETNRKPENYQKPETYSKSENFQKPENYHKPENYQKPENFQRQESYQNSRYRYYQRQYEPERKVDEGRVNEPERSYVHRDRSFNSGRFEHPRNRTGNPMMPFQYRQPYVFRQMSPNTWCRRTPPNPLNPAFGTARRPPPDTRNPRR